LFLRFIVFRFIVFMNNLSKKEFMLTPEKVETMWRSALEQGIITTRVDYDEKDLVRLMKYAMKRLSNEELCGPTDSRFRGIDPKNQKYSLLPFSSGKNVFNPFSYTSQELLEKGFLPTCDYGGAYMIWIRKYPHFFPSTEGLPEYDPITYLPKLGSICNENIVSCGKRVMTYNDWLGISGYYQKNWKVTPKMILDILTILPDGYLSTEQKNMYLIECYKFQWQLEREFPFGKIYKEDLLDKCTFDEQIKVLGDLCEVKKSLKEIKDLFSFLTDEQDQIVKNVDKELMDLYDNVEVRINALFNQKIISSRKTFIEI
jgi:hypothetical protein